MDEEWDQTLRPWRRASGLIALVQTPALVTAILLVFSGGVDARMGVRRGCCGRNLRRGAP
jgi:hypothetical protein